MLCVDLCDKTINHGRLLSEAIMEAVGKQKLPMGWKHVQRFLTDDEKEKMRSDVAHRLVEVFTSLPSEKEFEAAARAGEAKKGWYARSARTILDVFGPDAPRFAALLASTSPQVSVKENLRLSMRIWTAWIDAGRPQDQESIDKVAGGAIGEDRWRKMGWRPNASRALQHDTPEKITLSSGTSGDNPKAGKVDSFRANLLGDLSRVTNDAWMAHFADVDQKLFSSKAGYLAMTARVRAVAKKMGWQPAEVQETVWSLFKALHEKQGQTHTGRETMKVLTDNDIDDSSDFYDLITKDPEVIHALNKLRDRGLVGQPSPQLRDRGQDPAQSPLARAEAGGLAGSLARIADRAEDLKHRQDTQELATRGWSFPEAADVRLTGHSASFVVDKPREVAELKEKNRVGDTIILGRKDGKWDILYGTKELFRKPQGSGFALKVTYTDRKTVTPPTGIDLEKWREVERKKQERMQKLSQTA